LEEGEVGVAHVVKGDLGVDPGEVLGGALPLVVHHAGQQALPVPERAARIYEDRSSLI
jgi:hypothetical protein